jgi:lipopolysaccharide/colanic/teichoic acid biosynthesis glycosyltransferase
MSQASPLNAMSIGDATAQRGRLRLLARRRYQIIGALLFAVMLPAGLAAGFDPAGFAFIGLQTTGIATFGAVIVGEFLLRRMTAFPGVSTVAAMLPAFGGPYASAVLIFFFARVDYSRFQFIVSFVAVILWFGFVGLVEPRLRRARLLLLPFGKAENLLTSTQADWRIARNATELPSDVNGVVADLGADLGPTWEQLLARAALAGLPVYHWKQVAESLSGMVDIEHLSENNLGSLLPSSVYLRFKRLVDVLAAIAVLPVAVPINAVAALAILITDGGPVLFRQERMGFRGRPFTVLKLRTMRNGGDSGSDFTEENDPRIIRIGHFLRRYRIDEIPQITNILRGEMSWIGPRPESIKLAQWYESEVPFYSYRHIVRPGITGWAQINQGNVAEVEAATGKLRYDFYYIKYFSPWLDVLIVVRTIRTVLSGFGAL